MPRRIVDLRRERPLLDIASFGRRGPQSDIRLTPEILGVIRRTVRRTPEVVVKISGGGQSVRQVLEHLRYIQRRGELAIETDRDERLQGRGSHRRLVEDWDLDLEVGRVPGQRVGSTRTPRLVHNIVFSMPPGTPPKALLAAVRDFADIEWGGRHRYAMVLHTDAAHPHVHVVVKAVSELGERLNPDPSMLREWRAMFAERLRAQGVAANATERAVRGEPKSKKRDGRYWAEQRGAGSRQRDRLLEIAVDLRNGNLGREPGGAALNRTRRDVVSGWLGAADALERGGYDQEATAARAYTKQLPPVRTERQLLAEQWMHHLLAKRARGRDQPQWR